jgi:hypothetical protein
MNPTNGSNDRLDRIEQALERFERGLDHLLENQAKHQEHLQRNDRLITRILDNQDDLKEGARALMTSQVLFADQTREAFTDVAHKLAELAEAQKHTDERLNQVINVVDELVRRTPPPA